MNLDDSNIFKELLKLKASKDLSQFSVHSFDSSNSLFIPAPIWETYTICVGGVVESLRGVVERSLQSINECFINTHGSITPGVTVSLKANSYKVIKEAIHNSLGCIGSTRVPMENTRVYSEPDEIKDLTLDQLLDLGLKHQEDLNKIDREKNPREWAQAYNRLKSLKSSFVFDVFQIEGSNEYHLLITARIDPLLETTFETTTSDNTFPQNVETNKIKFDESEILSLVKDLEDPIKTCEAGFEGFVENEEILIKQGKDWNKEASPYIGRKAIVLDPAFNSDAYHYIVNVIPLKNESIEPVVLTLDISWMRKIPKGILPSDLKETLKKYESLDKSATFPEHLFNDPERMMDMVDMLIYGLIHKVINAYKKLNGPAKLDGGDVVAMSYGYFEAELPSIVRLNSDKTSRINEHLTSNYKRYTSSAEEFLRREETLVPYEPNIPQELPDRPSDVTTLSKRDIEIRRDKLLDQYNEEKDSTKKQQIMNRVKSLGTLLSLIPKKADRKEDAIKKFMDFIESELARGVSPRDMATFLEKIRPNYPQHSGLIDQIVDTLVTNITHLNSLNKGLDIMADSDIERARKELERKKEEAELKRIQDMKVDKSRNDIEQKVKPFEIHKPLNPKGGIEDLKDGQV